MKVSDMEEAQKQEDDSRKVQANDNATFPKHDGIETFAELKERLSIKKRDG